jgi:two-component system invasion response regulator UvrY
MIRECIALALKTTGDFAVIEQTSEMTELASIVKAQSPDIAILEEELSDVSDWNVIQYLQKHHRDCRLIVLYTNFSRLAVRRLVSLGIRGFVSKHSSFASLIETINEVHADGYSLCKKSSRVILPHIIPVQHVDQNLNAVSLTELETQTLVGISSDKTIRQIANESSLSIRTIERCKKNLLAKARVKTVAGLVLFALKFNYIALDDD